MIPLFDTFLFVRYVGCGARFVPSVVEESHVAAAATFFEDNYGITLDGFYQWKQEGAPPPPPVADPLPSPTRLPSLPSLPTPTIPEPSYTRGYYAWSWGSGSYGPSGATNGACEYVAPDTHIQTPTSLSGTLRAWICTVAVCLARQ